MNLKEVRWELLEFNCWNSKVTIYDCLLKKHIAYYIPNMTKAIIKEHILHVTTSKNKVMQINLANASRRFTQVNQLKTNLY